MKFSRVKLTSFFFADTGVKSLAKRELRILRHINASVRPVHMHPKHTHSRMHAVIPTHMRACDARMQRIFSYTCVPLTDMKTHLHSRACLCIHVCIQRYTHACSHTQREFPLPSSARSSAAFMEGRLQLRRRMEKTSLEIEHECNLIFIGFHFDWQGVREKLIWCAS